MRGLRGTLLLLIAVCQWRPPCSPVAAIATATASAGARSVDAAAGRRSVVAGIAARCRRNSRVLPAAAAVAAAAAIVLSTLMLAGGHCRSVRVSPRAPFRWGSMRGRWQVMQRGRSPGLVLEIVIELLAIMMVVLIILLLLFVLLAIVRLLPIIRMLRLLRRCVASQVIREQLWW